ncbi:MAG: sporulation protein [Oscillospiraceae bacterium]|nr:sporulation protein [Oscillospiraceae bacterium]
MKGSDFLWERLDLPGEAIPGQPLVEIAGDSRVLIEQHRGVREYSRERIGVNVKFGVVQVCGSCLELRRMTREQLVIRGKIDGISLLRRKNP